MQDDAPKERLFDKANDPISQEYPARCFRTGKDAKVKGQVAN